MNIVTVVRLLQGHALYTRQAGSTIPCPYVDYDKGFNAVFARAYGLKDGETISKIFGSDWGELPALEHMSCFVLVLSLCEHNCQ